MNAVVVLFAFLSLVQGFTKINSFKLNRNHKNIRNWMCEAVDGQDSEVVESREIINLEKKVSELKGTISKTIEQRKELEQEYKILDDEYGSEIERVKKEFSRMRERSIEDSTDLINSARASALKEILPMTDNYARAKSLYNPQQTETETKILAAYDEVFTNFGKVIAGFGLERVETIGKPFDYQFMEAIMTAPSTEYAKDLVCIEYQLGYKMGNKMIRPAMVVVSSGPGPQ
jgi:molecular chaperone GrpE